MNKCIILSVQPQWVHKILNENNSKILENEIWCDLKNYEGFYIISNYGRIISLPRATTKGKLLKPQISKFGYYMQLLTKKGKRKLCRVSRLVAITFIENKNNDEFVNHINGIKTDNRVENLEWCSRSYNQKEAYRLGLQKPSLKQKEIAKKMCLETKSKKVKQYDLKGNLLNVYNSISEASRITGISVTCICRVCKNIRKQTGGFIWGYAYKEE